MCHLNNQNIAFTHDEWAYIRFSSLLRRWLWNRSLKVWTIFQFFDECCLQEIWFQLFRGSWLRTAVGALQNVMVALWVIWGRRVTSLSRNRQGNQECFVIPVKWEAWWQGCKLKLFPMQTERCGWGLVADEDIKAGSFLVEYVGEGEKSILSSALSNTSTHLIY